MQHLELAAAYSGAEAGATAEWAKRANGLEQALGD